MLSKKIVIKVSGLKTLKDANKVRNNLNKIECVKSIKVSLKNNKITISHNSSINILEIQKIINESGYKYIGVE